MGRFVNEFESLYRAVQTDIFKWCRLLNFTPTPQQEKLLGKIQQGAKRIAVKSGRGTGKSSISGVIGSWRAFRNFGARTVATAPTMRQCKDIWLQELKKTFANADAVLQKFVKITKTKLIIGGVDAWGCELVTATRPINAQGFHNDHLTFIVEEASGVTRPFLENIEGTVTNDDSLVLLIGNPNLRDCGMFDCFNSQRHHWELLTFDSRESPLTSKEQISLIAEKYGEDSDFFRIQVKGEFPVSDPQSIMSSEDLDACTDKKQLYPAVVKTRSTDGRPAKQFGIDFARFGGDENVIMRRSGNAIVQWGFWVKTDPSPVVDTAFRWQVEAGWKNHDCWYVPDAGGIGQGIMHRFYDAQKQIHEFHTQHRAVGQEYDNKATEAWFRLGELAKKRVLYIPNDSRLITQLCSRKFHTTKTGKLIIESKDEYCKRVSEQSESEGNSPDRADALIMAFYDQVASGGAVTGGAKSKQLGIRLESSNRLNQLWQG